MRGFVPGLILGLLVSIALAGFAREVFFQGQRIYVKAAQENLRAQPKGDKVGEVPKGTELIVLKDSDKWVQVSLVGYIWKESVTADKRSLLGKPYKAMMIVVRTEQEANDLLQKIRSGSLEFAAAAKDHSIDAPSAKRGGDLGEFYKGELTAEFENAIVNLQPNQLSAVVKTTIGYHIFKRIQ
ncbi:MAG: peptidylprolyl isomerase [bacterium]